MVILIAFGALTGLDGPRIAANLPTPWVGIWERINIGIFLLWVVVLAIALLRRPLSRGKIISRREAMAHVAGLVAPGFEEVRAEFERNFAERGDEQTGLLSDGGGVR